MRAQHWTLLVAIFGMILFGMVSVSNYLLHTQTVKTEELESALVGSAQAALAEGNIGETEIFETEETREDAIRVFYKTYTKAMRLYGNRQDLARYYVPFIMLVDNDGYYMSYIQSDIDFSGDKFYDDIVTTKTTWSVNYTGFTVRYFLNNSVEVTRSNGKTYSGMYDKVWEDMGKPSTLNFMASYDNFLAEKNYQICQLTEAEVNYYIKTHNIYENQALNADYTFTMPATDDDSHNRLMDEPSVIAFTQGYQKSISAGFVNAYALSGSIVDKARDYYIVEDSSGTLYYHEEGCSNVGRIDNVEKVTMYDAAKHGAIPCPDCVR